MNIFRAISDFARRLNGTKRCASVAELSRYVKRGDVRHLAYWIAQSIIYTRDKTPEDEWLSPDETLRRGEGDCEDMAGVAFAVMSSWGEGWSPQLVRLEKIEKDRAGKGWTPKAHAVCVYETPELTRGVIDNGALYEFKQEKKVAWAWIFSQIPGSWLRAFWVSPKGEKLNTVGWERA